MNFVLITPDGEEIFVPLTNARKLWEDARFNRNWQTVLLVTGWNSDINETNDALDTIYAAYSCRGSTNFVVNIFLLFIEACFKPLSE